MAHFGVSRPTLREAVRVLESERLVEVRRGSRTGARVRVPGPEIVARPAGLLLELSGATIADVMVARAGIEPMAARLLAESGTPEAFDELEKMLAEDIPAGWQSGRLAETTGRFTAGWWSCRATRRSAIIAGMLHEITVRHTAFVFKERRPVSKADYEKLMRSYRRLMQLMRVRRRCRRGGPLAQAPRHRARPVVEGTRDRQGPRRRWADGQSGHTASRALVSTPAALGLPSHRQQSVAPAARMRRRADMVDGDRNQIGPQAVWRVSPDRFRPRRQGRHQLAAEQQPRTRRPVQHHALVSVGTVAAVHPREAAVVDARPARSSAGRPRRTRPRPGQVASARSLR